MKAHNNPRRKETKKKIAKKVKQFPLTFDQMVTEAQMRIHFALLEFGAKGMREAIHQSMDLILRWGMERRDELDD